MSAYTELERALAAREVAPPKADTVVRCSVIRVDRDSDVVVTAEIDLSTMRRGHLRQVVDVAIDDPLLLIAFAMRAIKSGHGADVMDAAKQLVSSFTPKEPK